MPKFFTKHSRPKATGLSCGPSKTQQHFKDNCDINSIIKKHSRTGCLPLNNKQPMYGDFSNLETLHDLKNKLIQINNEFMALPSDIRDKFDHDPQNLQEWLSDAQNTNEAVQLGLLPKECFIEPEKPVNQPVNEPVEHNNVDA